MPASSGNPINSFLRRSEWGTVGSGGLGQGTGGDTLETSKRVTRIEYHVTPADDHARFQYIVAVRRGIFAEQRGCLHGTFEPLGLSLRCDTRASTTASKNKKSACRVRDRRV